MIRKKKISELAETTDPQGLWVLVTDERNRSRKFGLGNLGSLVPGLETLIYCHCGNDDDPRKELPALLRGEPYDGCRVYDAQGQVLAGKMGVPRVQLYFDGKYYDNAPADYAGGKFVEVVDRYYWRQAGGQRTVGGERKVLYRLTTEPSPYSSNALGTLKLEYVLVPGLVVTTSGGGYYFDGGSRRILYRSPRTLPELSIGSRTRTTGLTISSRMSVYGRGDSPTAGTGESHSGSILSQATVSMLAQAQNAGVLSLLG